jgi:hypothetical protein
MKHRAWLSGTEKRSQGQATINVRAHDDGWISAHYGSLDESGKLVCITPTFPGTMGVGGYQCGSDQPLDLRMKCGRFASSILTNFDDCDSQPTFNEYVSLRHHVCVLPCRRMYSNQDIKAFH